MNSVVEKRKLRHIVCAVLCIALLYEVYSAFSLFISDSEGVGWRFLLNFVCYVILIISVAKENYLLLSFGVALEIFDITSLVYDTLKLIPLAKKIGLDLTSTLVPLAVSMVVPVISYVLLIISVFKREYSVKICFFAVALSVIDYLIGAIKGDTIVVTGLFVTLLRIVPIGLLGIIMQTGDWREQLFVLKGKQHYEVESSDVFVKLENLNNLRLTGVISQEEFEQKKKQLLEL